MLWTLAHPAEFSPLSEMRRLQREMNRLFEGAGSMEEAFPALNIWSGSDKVLVTAEIPGIEPKDIELSVLGDQLSIQGELKSGNGEEKDLVWHRRERPSGKFVRTVRLPFEVDASKIEAKSKNGLLSISLPRAESSKPRKIAVSGE